MRGTLALLLATVAVGGASASSTPTVRATLSGTCTAANTLDQNGVVTSSTVTCTTSAPCSCEGATRLELRTSARLPGNGGSGHERGTLTATGPGRSVTLSLSGTRTGVGLSSGSWTLAGWSGGASADLARSGSYSAQTTTLAPIPGKSPAVVSSTVRIAATIGCWDCPARA